MESPLIITKMSLPRRTFLRGLGATLWLPFLDAMVPALSALANTAANPVRRLGFVYIPNGAIMADWTPAVEGSAFDFTRILKPIEPFRDHVLVLSGLSQKAGSVGAHAPKSASWLAGVAPKKSLTIIEAGVTADQIAAEHLREHTQLASLELGLEGADLVGNCDAGWSCAYTNTVSWRTPSTPLPVDTNPRVVFERLFGDSDTTSAEARLSRLKKDRSILDVVMRQVADLERTLGTSDRGKLNQYLDAVRDVEQRIQQAEQNAGDELPEIERPVGIPERFEDHAKLMLDLQVLAYQSDLTRVTTFMFGREISNRSYRQIGVPEPHHSTSHHQNDKEKVEKITRINTLHMRMFAYYLEKLRATPDGDGTLLDHAMIVYGGGMSDPNLHLHDNLPIVLAGGGAGQTRAGRHLRYPPGTEMTNLLLTLLEKLDVNVDKLGDSTGRLDLLSGV